MPLGSLFGTQIGPKSTQDRSKTGFKRLFFEKCDFSKNLGKRKEKHTFLTPKGDQKWPKIAPRRPQDGLKELLFRCQNLSSILVRFGVRFGRFWGAFWEPSWRQNRSKNRPKIDLCPQTAPRPPQDRQRAPQERPKSTQEAPKRRPRAAKRHPKGTKRHPKGTQKALKSPPKAPKST